MMRLDLRLLAWTGALAATLACTAVARDVSAQDFRDSVSVRPGGTLRVDLTMGSVQVQTHDDDRIEVEAQSFGFANAMEFRLESDGRDAALVGRRGSWFGFPGRVRVNIQIPEEYSLDVRTSGGDIEVEDVEGDVRVLTSGGSIDLDRVRGEVRASTSGGSVRADDVEGDLRARTSGGRIRVSDVLGDVDVETSGGSIDAHDVGGRVRAKTSGGSISARFERDPEGRLETSGGSISVEFDEDSRLDLDAETSGGRVALDDDLPARGLVERQRVHATVNGGGALLRLRTSGGNVRVRAR